MTQCIRTRTRFSTPLEDILWTRSQDRQSSYIAAQEAARTKKLRIEDILTRFSFTLDEETTLHSPDGSYCFQAGMTVVNRSDCNERYTVIAKLVEAGEEWSCLCPPFHQEDGPLVIEAVQLRRDRKRQQRLQAKAA